MESVEIPQRREIRTVIPGPRSLELSARRKASVPAGVGATMPIFAERAYGGIVVDVDGNSFIDLGAGIAVLNVGSSAAAVVEGVVEQARRFTHTCFQVTGFEGYIELAERLNALAPGSSRETQLLRELRCRSSRERGEDRPIIHRPSSGGGVRPCVPRQDAAHDVAHRQGDAVQGGIRAVRTRDLPRAVQLPLPLHRWSGA